MLLLGKLSDGDMVAHDTMYHTHCLSKLYKKVARDKNQSVTPTDNDSICQSIALAELVSFLEECRCDSDDNPVFKLSELSKMYATRLEQMGVNNSHWVHSTRLKERLIQHCLELTSYKDGHNVILAFSEDVAAVLKKATEKNGNSEAMLIAKTASIIHHDLLNMEKSAFHGTFETNCQETYVPQSLQSFIEMIMGGASIKTQASSIVEKEAALTVSQLIRFNSVVWHRKDSQATYSKDRETPLPAYLGLLVHAETRKKAWLTSYATLVFHDLKAVCPSNLKLKLFTTSAVNNIDHSPSATTATGSLHDTAISLFQHQTRENHGQEWAVVQLPPDQPTSLSIAPLPKQYAEVLPLQPGKLILHFQLPQWKKITSTV